MSNLAERFMALFVGLDSAHGAYDYRKATTVGNKLKGKAYTKYEPYEVHHWEEHLAGRMGLGVIPITAQNKVQWGAIDIDVYDTDHKATLQRVAGTPLVPVVTKSGGLHLFLFMKVPVAASIMKDKLTEIASALGFGGCEKFPKQSTIFVERGDVGNWLNMPYYKDKGASNVGVSETGAKLSPAAFLDYAFSKQLTLKAFKEFTILPKDDSESELPGGPPCLQHLVEHGFPQGTRNHGLFNLAVYYKKAYPEDWERKVEEANVRWMGPGSSEEVASILKSIRRKEYAYKCKDQPICAHCDKALCKTRKYGIGASNLEIPVISNLTKITTKPPMYFLDVNGVRVGPIASDDLLLQARFQKIVFEGTGIVMPTLKTDDWREMLQKLSNEAAEVEVPNDNSSEGQLFEQLELFVTGTRSTTERNHLIIGRVWENEGHYHFRMQDFLGYLSKARFTDYKPHVIAAHFRKAGMETKGIKANGKYTNVWVVSGQDLVNKLTLTEVGDQPY